jgi:hypothetical protein
VNEPGDELLSRAALTLDQDREVGRCNARDAIAKNMHRGAAAEQRPLGFA